jgi:hypothetical protein
MNLGSRRRNIEREERIVERDRREDAAGKLTQRIPDLTSLSLSIHEARSDGCTSDTQYIRRIVVEHAPALFEMRCSYAYCSNGGYDVTREVLNALASRAARFEGESACRGSCGEQYCSRVLRYIGTATYR